MASCFIETPVGRLRVSESDGAISRVEWTERDGEVELTPLLRDACRQLEDYFDRILFTFDLPLAPRGSGFQQRVYRAMRDIEYGRTRTYGDLAMAVDGSPQAVGQACGSNPIPIFIPCHRVVGFDGLGGFSGAGGVETKVELLRLEGAYSLLL